MRPWRGVLTGGPCAGKSTVLSAMSQTLANEIVVVPEAATRLFEGGYPLPRPDWTLSEWLKLQHTVTDLQLELENVAAEQAMAQGRRGILCDRAPFDNLAYPEGHTALLQRWGNDLALVRD